MGKKDSHAGEAQEVKFRCALKIISLIVTHSWLYPLGSLNKLHVYKDAFGPGCIELHRHSVCLSDISLLTSIGCLHACTSTQLTEGLPSRLCMSVPVCSSPKDLESICCSEGKEGLSLGSMSQQQHMMS